MAESPQNMRKLQAMARKVGSDWLLLLCNSYVGIFSAPYINPENIKKLLLKVVLLFIHLYEPNVT